jgi:hypothetical protein
LDACTGFALKSCGSKANKATKSRAPKRREFFLFNDFIFLIPPFLVPLKEQPTLCMIQFITFTTEVD